jgi:hypothetical protein
MITIELYDNDEKLGLLHFDENGRLLGARAYNPQGEEDIGRLREAADHGHNLLPDLRRLEQRAREQIGFHGRLVAGEWPPGSDFLVPPERR